MRYAADTTPHVVFYVVYNNAFWAGDPINQYTLES